MNCRHELMTITIRMMQLTHVWTHLVRISKIPTLVHVGRLCKTTCMPQIYIYIYTWLKEHGNVTVPKIGQANANNSCVKASTFWGFEVLYNILKIQISFWGNVSYKMILRKILGQKSFDFYIYIYILCLLFSLVLFSSVDIWFFQVLYSSIDFSRFP